VKHPIVVIVGAISVALVSVTFAVTKLEYSSDLTTLLSSKSDEIRTTEKLAESFGEEPVLVLIKADLSKLLLTDDLGRLIGLEGCLSGRVPKDTEPIGGRSGPCSKLAEDDYIKAVYGPGTFINEATRQIGSVFSSQLSSAEKAVEKAGQRAARQAEKAGKDSTQQRLAKQAAEQSVKEQYAKQLIEVAVRSGLSSLPSIGDPSFVNQLVFDPRGSPGTPKSQVRQLLPSSESAVIQIRLKHGLTRKQRLQAFDLIESAVKMPQWQLPKSSGEYVVSGTPLVVEGVVSGIRSDLGVLMLIATVSMGLVLLVLFSGRLLPLGVTLCALSTLVGGMVLTGTAASVATVAALPVLVGLGVDFTVQLQSRIEQELDSGLSSVEAVEAAMRGGGVTVATAGAATVVALTALLLSSLPIVRDFALTITVGVLLSLLAALVITPAATVFAASSKSSQALLVRAQRVLAASVNGARSIVTSNWLVQKFTKAVVVFAKRAVSMSLQRSRLVLILAALLAAAGWVGQSRMGAELDVRKLLASNQETLQNLDTLNLATGSVSTVDVLVKADRSADAKTVRWLNEYQRGVLEKFGPKQLASCSGAKICSGSSLADLFNQPRAKITDAEVDETVDLLPKYFASAFIDQKKGVARVSFTLASMSLNEQTELVSELEKRLNPPAGVTAQLAGLPVISTGVDRRMQTFTARLGLQLMSVLLITVLLITLFKSARRALRVTAAVCVSVGVSSLILYLSGVQLTPMSLALGALTVALATEFSVILSERFEEGSRSGLCLEDAVFGAYRLTGMAVLISGVTALVGFTVLLFSDIPIVREFGLTTLLNIVVTLLVVLVVLPALINLSTTQLKSRDNSGS